MRILLPVFGAFVLASGVISASLWQKLAAERKLTADLSEQLREATLRARTPAATPVLSVGAAIPPPTTVTPAPAAATSATPAVTTGRVTISGNSSAALQNAINSEMEMWKDPEYRKARLAQARTSVRRQNADLAEELGITEAEANKIIDVLAEYQVNMNAELTVLSMNAQNDPAAQQEMARRQTEMQRQREESLAALLGPRLSQYQQYQQTLPARSRVNSLNSTLSQAGAPLTGTQLKSLTTVMVAQQQRQQQDLQDLTRGINPQDPEARARITEQLQNRTSETNRRVLEAATPFLNAQQISALRTEFEQQDAISRASARVRARAGQSQF